MGWTLGKLTALQIKKLDKPGRHGDGGGLYLEIEPSGSRRWTLRIVAKGKRRDIGLGSAHPETGVSLAAARSAADGVRQMVRAGVDPVAERKRLKAPVPTFQAAALEVHREHAGTWKNEKHADQWLATMERYVFPVIGKRLVSEIDGPAVRDTLLPIWLEIPETARRVRQRIGVVLDWAASKGLRFGDNPVRAVSKGLPKQPKQRGHFSALDYSEVPAFISKLRDCSSGPIAKLAFEFLILTAARTSEVLNAEWSEFDLERCLWTVPPSRMKAGRPHVVPLTARAMAILKQVRTLHTGKGTVVFEGRPGLPFSNMVFLKLLEAMNERHRATAHGFRSAFRDWAAETTGFPSDVVEMALAHAIRDKTEAAYRRGDLLDKRRKLMESWESYVELENGQVIKLRRK